MLALVATIVPEVEPVLTDTVNISSAPDSVVRSASGVTVNDPVPEFIVTVPDVATKSALIVVVFSTVQYNVVPLGTPDVVILNVTPVPSLTLYTVGVTVYAVGGRGTRTRIP
jgi:hypothetical protein